MNHIKKQFQNLIFYLLLLALWELVYIAGVDILKIWKPYIFPSPLDVIKTLIFLWQDQTLLIAVSASLQRIVLGCGISVVIGTIIGVIIVQFPYLERNFSSLILGMQTLPSICWLPFAILWFGLSESSILFVTAIGSVFAVSIAIETGIKNINPLYIRAARTMGADSIKLYRHVIFPASLPAVISGMKQGWSFAWRALMAGEMLAATKGLGYVLMMGRDLADISQVMAVMVVIIALGLLVEKLIFGKIEISLRKKWGLDRA
ncbi:ABC transporter permease [Sporomusa sphaeroides]|uniref:ABC transporter permease n=1 Tax=Sporomusa sphaeroides TaxID=47679 RepID=UPI0031593812